MLNLSILFLTHFGCHNSPFISSSCLFQRNTKLFSNIYFSRSFSTFFYSYERSHLSSYHFKDSRFSYFLSRSIFLQKQIFLTNQIYELTNQYFDEDPVSIWNCIFRKFNLPDEQGAAIYTTYAIQLFNVFFDDICSGAGAFYTESQITANYVTFQKVKANSSACFISKPGNISNSTNDSNKLENILIQNAVSDQNFGFLSQEKKCTFLSNSNVTHCQSTNSNGAIECHFSDSHIKFVIFSYIKSPKNSISLSINSNQFQYSHCLFYSITYDKYLFSVMNAEDFCFQFCHFSSLIFKKAKDENFQIFASNCTNLKINKCCFDVKKERIFINSQFAHFELDNNFYSEKKCFNKITFENENVGYSYQRTPTYNPQIAPSPTHNFFFDKDSNNYVDIIDLLLSITFAILCCLVFLMIFIFIQNNFHHLFRKPRFLFNFKDSREIL